MERETAGVAIDFEPRGFGAGNRVRTGDLNLGKVALYQLSYSRSYVFFKSLDEWRPLGGSNPCYRRERAVS